jgi:hypothetical protein
MSDTPTLDQNEVSSEQSEKKKRGRPKGYVMSDETKQKISAANVGKKKARRKV